MATYLVGDIQGCLAELQALLSSVHFDPATDELWLVGDLVARGPASLQTLRFIQSLGNSAKAVLGNHDLHLLAVAHGFKTINPKDQTQAILDAPDCESLLTWLRHQPLLRQHPTFDFVVSHAGIAPEWDLKTAATQAKLIEKQLQSANYQQLLQQMYGDQPARWCDAHTPLEKTRFTINSLTRMRFCYADGALDMAEKMPPQALENPDLMPWFDVPRRNKLPTVIFGHWAALGQYQGHGVICLDSGCVWGNGMTMLRWEDQQYFHQPSLTAHQSAN
ncbi:Bis(5'-nucleosyl)-tetraphosphatase, symmetrical [Vibrio stylophorae]|uniref:Bis(5'-nucleosyl)-tetraphosphatase, symmetrical n=1 Tax=Vibrio stylophorae TaxID=659351 RepID=A0ABN8DQV9_9VIBR|nr:symmetrical bis(5'-nucleosyl)-tetraphosphatase [Vibrio stylophorae]CAH0532564.1 Bis(5'-nucleosyl)-tetraphosphatase, symmetrical [Vibrio stylophorae]